MDQFTLPEDLLFQILLRLPATPLLRFRSVCQSWLSHIDSSRFISQHARRTSDSHLVVVHDRTDYDSSTDWVHPADATAFCFTFIFVDDLRREPKYIVFAQNGRRPLRAKFIVSSFDGVICLLHTKMVGGADVDDVSLWNPAIQQSKVLPAPLQSNTEEDSCQYGFGFDVENNDYKVVKVALNECKSNVEVYSLSMDRWRVVGAVVPPKFFITSNPAMPFRNGIYCWLGTHSESRGYSILSFNFSSETFRIIPGPEFYTDCNPILTFLREKIACVDRVVDDSKSFFGQFNIWVLDEYGAKESWTKLYTITFDQVGQPLGFSTDGKLVLLKGEDRQKLHLFDPCTQEVNDVLTPYNIFQVAMYKESLVSVKSANGVTKRGASEENPPAKGLLNVPLDRHEDLKIVCGEDQAPGRFARSDVDLPSDTLEETSAYQETSEGPLTANGASGSKSGRPKRSRPSDED